MSYVVFSLECLIVFIAYPPAVATFFLCFCVFLMVMKDGPYATSLGSRLLMTVYKGIAPGEDRKALPSLDINTRRLADDLLQLAFSLSQQVSATFLKI